MNNEINKKRLPLLDIYRGVAIIFMIIFHSIFDLTILNLISNKALSENYWFYFPRLIVIMFLICVGAGINITHKKKFKSKKFFMRLALIAFWAATVSIATFFIFHNQWIKFGMLHVIAISSLLAIPFINKPIISLLSAIIILILFFIIIPNQLTFPPSEWAPHSLDYIPIYPWFSAVLIGIFLEHIGFFRIRIAPNSLKFVQLLGQHSLIIYIIHQPLIYGTLYILSIIK
ncbi:MAG: DUF1624 domain-containing protein [Oligoflexia bacterium]|nr:DUF1624 domain-containing protein [Oligoflexia bacterium]